MTETTPDVPEDDQDAEPTATAELIEQSEDRDQAEGEPGQAGEDR